MFGLCIVWSILHWLCSCFQQGVGIGDADRAFADAMKCLSRVLVPGLPQLLCLSQASRLTRCDAMRCICRTRGSSKRFPGSALTLLSTTIVAVYLGTCHLL